MINQEHPLIFTHIPKTGGMSIFANMCRHFGVRIADMYNISALRPDPIELETLLNNEQLCVYAGHFPYGLHQWLSRPAYYMAFVRHPIKRVFSLYHYSLPYRDILRELCQQTGRSRQELFTRGEAVDFYQDFTPWFESEATLSRFLSCTSPELENGMVRRFSGVGLRAAPCTREDLQLAKDNIAEHYAFVGIQERFSESAALFRMTFRLNFREYHVNQGNTDKRKQHKLTIPLKRRIKELNQFDLELYDWIIARFEQQQENPPTAATLPGGRRTDFDQVGLWHAVGESPVRKATMEFDPRKAN